jgi:truncated hemoglobin YjbI
MLSIDTLAAEVGEETLRAMVRGFYDRVSEDCPRSPKVHH